MLLAVVKLSERLDWGFRSPNITAIYIALLMTGVWALPGLFPRKNKGDTGKEIPLWRILRVVAWVAALCVCIYLTSKLFQTGSRGGAVAVLAGFGAMLAARLKQWREWPLWRVSAVLLALVIVGVLAWQIHPAERLTLQHSIGDASITNRLRIWKWAPAMIMDAPGGWGERFAPKALFSWYQDADHLEVYSEFVNSHLEFLIEHAWPLRLVYLFGWLLALRLVWPIGTFSPKRRSFEEGNFPVAPLGTMVAWGVGSTFTTMHAEWQLWVAPCALFLWAVGIRVYWRQWPSVKNLLWSVGTPAFILLSVCLLVGGFSPLSTNDLGRSVKLGTGKVQIVVLAGTSEHKEQRNRSITRDDTRELRIAWKAHKKKPTLLWTTQAQRIPDETRPQILVLIGKPDFTTWPPIISRAERIIALAPEFPPEAFFDETTLPKVQACYGELSNAAHSAAWENSGRCSVLLGTGDFFSDWANAILDGKLPETRFAEEKQP
ncbi:MAG: O-antigen ligase family protein [Puniceicoccales bacterium]|jgi:hypothetical protein|nr:O-antigen ligase family protein [Puniceicoccales bacterium]